MAARSHPDGRGESTQRYALLFLTLFAMFLVVPFLRRGSFGDLVLDVMFLVVLLSALSAVWANRKLVIAAAAMGTGLLAGPGWGLFGPSTVTQIVSSVGMVGFVGLVVAGLGIDMYRARSVTFATILGACSIYLLLGLMWFGVFGLIEAVQPHSFSGVEVHEADLARNAGDETIVRAQLFYFTFVTLTTLGYGDVVPVSQVARVYSTLAALTGQLFIATMVARLVGIHTAGHMNRGPD